MRINYPDSEQLRDIFSSRLAKTVTPTGSNLRDVSDSQEFTCAIELEVGACVSQRIRHEALKHEGTRAAAQSLMIVISRKGLGSGYSVVDVGLGV